MAQNDKQDMTVQQETKQYLTADHKKEDKAVKNMTVKELVNYLEVKQKLGKTTPAEDEQLEKGKEKITNDKSIDALNDPDLKKEKNKDIEEPKDIFKEDDILKYMYNDWLLAGANWLFKKSYKGTAITADYVAGKLWKFGAYVVEGYKTGDQPAPLDDMTRIVTNADKNLLNYNTQHIENADKAQEKFNAKIDRFKSGQGTDEEKQTLLYQIINELPEKSREKFCNDAKIKYENATNNIKAINYMASMLARTQIIQDAMEKENPAQFEPEYLKALTKRNTLLIVRALDNSPNPAKTMEEMFKNIEKASKTANESMDKGRYKSNEHKKWWKGSKTPYENKSLNAINATLGLTKPEDSNDIPQSNKPKGLCEELIEHQNLDNLLSQLDTQCRNAQFSNLSEMQQHQARKRYYFEKLNRINIRNVPKHLRKKQNNAFNQAQAALGGNER